MLYRAVFLSWRLFPKLAAETPASSQLGHLLLLVNFLVAQVAFQLGLIPSSEVDFIGRIESHDIKFFGGIFGNSDDILSDILTAGAEGHHGRWSGSSRNLVLFASSWGLHPPVSGSHPRGIRSLVSIKDPKPRQGTVDPEKSYLEAALGQPQKPPVPCLHLRSLLNQNRNSPASLVQTSYSKLKAAPSVPGALAARNIYIHPITRITSSWDDPVMLITQSGR